MALTPQERAAIACDMFLVGLVKLEMLGDDYSLARLESQTERKQEHARAVNLLEGWVDEYANDTDLPRDDRMKLDVFKRVLKFLKGEDKDDPR